VVVVAVQVLITVLQPVLVETVEMVVEVVQSQLQVVELLDQEIHLVQPHLKEKMVEREDTFQETGQLVVAEAVQVQ
jgi:hypothetical protein